MSGQPPCQGTYERRRRPASYASGNLTSQQRSRSCAADTPSTSHTTGHQTLASFKAPDAAELGVGIQLVVEGSDADGFFGPFRDALINTPALLAEYNQLKLRLDGLDCERYTERG